MATAPDPIVDLLLAADLPGIAAKARERAAPRRPKPVPYLDDIGQAWRLLAEACDELLPITPTHHAPVQPVLFPMSRVKSARPRRRS